MTVSSTTRTAGPFAGTGLVTTYAFAFYVFQNTDVLVQQTDVNGNIKTLVYGSDYTVTLNSNQSSSPGGTITLTTALPSGYTLVMTSQVKALQSVDIQNPSNFYPSVVTQEFDYLTVLVQQLQQSISQTLTLPLAYASGVSTQLPAPVANQLIGWNATGTGLQNFNASTLASIVAFGTANADIFTGDGSTKVFNLSANPGNQANLDVAISGVTQLPGVDYVWSGGQVVTFTAAPPNGAKVLLRYMQALPQGTMDSAATTFLQAGSGAASRTVQDKLRETVSATDFMSAAQKADIAAGTATVDVSTAVQAAVNSLPSGGGEVVLWRGAGLFSAPVTTRSNVLIRGYGDATQIVVSTDIEVFNSDTTTVNSNISLAILRDFYINKTFSGATTKYDIHLQNPLFCKIERVHIKSGHGDTAYSSTNVGGIWLDKPDTSTQGAYCNSILDCWIQNNSIYLRNITDSTIRGGWVWGHVRQFAIRVRAGGNIDITNVNGIITSQYNGGIWLDGTGVNQVRIVGCEWDGNPLLQRGDGIYCPQNATQVLIAGNTFWACGKNGVNVTDPVGWSITGNNFWKNNDNDAGFDDIRITGSTFAPSGNVVSGNTFTMDVARTNKGYAIREVNAGFNPGFNNYKGNALNGGGNYQSPAVLLLGSNEYDGSLGGTGRVRANATELGEGALGDPGGLTATQANTVNALGTLDLTVNTTSYLGNPGGFAGILTVTSTRLNAATQSRRTVYAVVGYGTTATFTSLATQDGSGGGAAFTVTMASNGVIRFTDTSGQQVGVRMAFYGSKSLA